MRIFLAGATGVIGAPLLARLLAAGHEVIAMTRSVVSAEALARAGAEPVVCDVFDAEGLVRVVAEARPEVVIHQLTAIPTRLNPRRAAELLEPTNRLRTEGTRNLVAAARASGARRFIAQSIAFVHRPAGDAPRTEAHPMYLDAPRGIRPVVAAVHDLEGQVLGATGLEGVVLRYGFFYGPGTGYGADGAMVADVRRRRVPIVGSGDGVFSFVHVDDAAAATVAALWGPSGLYQIVDDDPVPVRVWLPELARILEALPPRRVPRWLGRLAAGTYGIYLMCDQRGVSNEKARTQLGWSPMRRSWREGFAELA